MELRLALVTSHASVDWHARRLAKALARFGTVEVLDPGGLRVMCGRTGGRDVLVVLTDDGRDARRFDAVLLGRLASDAADLDLQLDAGRALELAGVPCVNRVGPMLAAQDKLWTAAVLARAGIPTPLCTSVPRPVDAIVGTAEVAPAVAKPLFGSLGDGLFRADDPRGRRLLLRRVKHGAHLVQRFVQPGGRDWRLFVVGDRVEACIRRDAAPGEWRSNVSKGARATAAVARRDWRELAIEATRALGLEVAGVDLVVGEDGPLVLEVNGVPNFRGIYRATARDMAPAIAERVARLARPARGRAGRGRLRAARGAG